MITEYIPQIDAIQIRMVGTVVHSDLLQVLGTEFKAKKDIMVSRDFLQELVDELANRYNIRAAG